MSPETDNDPAAPLMPKAGKKKATASEDPDETVGYGKQIHNFITGETANGKIYEQIMTMLVWLVVVAYIMVSVPEYEKHRPDVDALGFVANCVFAAEYLLRFLLAAEDDRYANAWAPPLAFLISLLSLVDLLTIVPYFILVAKGSHQLYGTQFFRVLRLFTDFGDGKGCSEATSVVMGVVRGSKWLLMSTAYFLLALWLMVAAAYHITERNNEKVGGRFNTLLSSMWWSLINLMGEYPLNQEFTAYGKVVGTITMFIAIGGVHGIPTGIIADGYTNYLDDDEEEEDGEGEDEDLLPLTKLELAVSGVDIESDRPLDKWYLFINAFTGPGRVFEGLIMVLVVVNLFSSMADTVESIHKDHCWRSFWGFLEPLSVVIFSVEYLIRFYAVGAHRRYRGLGRIRWAFTTFFSLVDLLAIVPWYIDLALPGDQVIPTTFIRSLRLFRCFRLVKAGKFVEGMNVFAAVLSEKAGILGMLAYGVGILWVFFSVLMYYTERHNPIAGIANEFNTVPRAMWATLLNFTGEYPLGDYTNMGKVVSTLVAFIAITIFGIPVAILSDGIDDKLKALDKLKDEHILIEDEEEEEMEDWKEVANETGMGQFYLFMQGQDLQEGDTTVEDPWWEVWGLRFEFGILGLILVNTVCFIVRTLPQFERGHYDDFFNTMETVSIVVYTTEYAMRLLATYGNPRLANIWYSPLNFFGYMFSAFGIIDLIALLPWYLAHLVPGFNKNLLILRGLRLFRLLRVERYLPVFNLLKDVVAAKFHSLFAAIFIMLVMTVLCATMLHYTEKGNMAKEGVTHYTMAYRFRSIPSSLFYTFIHLTGDYPLMKYTPWGRFVNFFMIIIAQCLVGIPLGIIVQGFSEVTKKKVDDAKQKRHESGLGIQAAKEWFDPADVEAVGPASSAQEGAGKGVGNGRPSQPLLVPGKQATCFGTCRPSKKRQSFQKERAEDQWVAEGLAYHRDGDGCGSGSRLGVGSGSGLGEREGAASGELEEVMGTAQQHAVFKAMNNSATFDRIQVVMVLLGLIGIVVQTDTSLWDSTAGEINTVLQIVVAAFFTIEYLARLYACPTDPKFRGMSRYTGTTWKNWKAWPRFCYATDFVGIIDLAAWLPLFIGQGLSSMDPNWSVVCRMMQILMIVKFDRRLPAFTLLDDVLQHDVLADDDEEEEDQKTGVDEVMSPGRILVCMFALSCILWVMFAALLYLIEKDRPEQDGSFSNMLMSLFITVIFIGGEWCRVDLTYPEGQLVGFLLALVGIGIIGIPIAIFFDGYADLSEKSCVYQQLLAPESDEEGSAESSAETLKGTSDEDKILQKQEP